MNGDAIAAEIAAAFAEAATATGEGELTGAIIRRGAPDESTYPPTLGAEKSYTFTALLDTFGLADYQRTEITERHAKVMVSRPVVAGDGEEIEPMNGDRLAISGKTYHIEMVDAVSPGGYALMWEVTAVRGED